MALIAAIRTAVRLNLSDGATVWSDNEIDRAVDEVTADFSRLIPNEKIHEVIIDKTVTDEAWTSDSGVAVVLNNKPIDFGSETVKQSTTVFTRNTDYTINYGAGTVTMLAAGGMADSTASTISYQKQSIAFDLSSLTDLISVVKVETSVGTTPQEEANFFIFNDILWITSSGRRSQTSVGDKTHLRIYYWAEHTAPGASTAGSFPLFLDEVLIKGTVAYCLFIKARGLLQEGEAEIELGNVALTDLRKNGGTIEDIETALTEFDVIESAIGTELALGAAKIVEAQVEYDVAIDSMITDVDTVLVTALAALNGATDSATEALNKITSGSYDAATTTALDKITTHLTGVSDSAKAALTDILTNVVATDVNTALDSVRTMHELILTAAGSAGYIQDADDQWAEEVKHILTDAGLPNAEDFLELGDDKIDTVNLGLQVAQQYANYAATTLAMADRWSDRRKDYIAMSDRVSVLAQTYIAEANSRLAGADRLINEATVWADVAETFISEASARLAQIDRLIGEAVQWREVAATMNDLATNRNVAAQMQIRAADGYVSMAMAYIDEAEGYIENGRILIEKAQTRLGIGNLNVAEGQGRVVIGQEYVDISDRYRADALERHANYWGMLTSRVQQARQRSMVSTLQYESGGGSNRLADLT